MSEYSEKLKDPRWQKKRLEILQRDNFTCQRCDDKTTTLIVHHKDYLPKSEPWDYPDILLITLCEDCHNAELYNDRNVSEQLLIHGLRKYFWDDELYIIYDGLEKLPALKSTESWMLAETLRWLFTTPELRTELDQRLWSLMHGGDNA